MNKQKKKARILLLICFGNIAHIFVVGTIAECSCKEKNISFKNRVYVYTLYVYELHTNQRIGSNTMHYAGMHSICAVFGTLFKVILKENYL